MVRLFSETMNIRGCVQAAYCVTKVNHLQSLLRQLKIRTNYNRESKSMSDQHSRTFDAVVIGAGFAGLYALYKLRKMGLSVKVFEAGMGSGALGTGTGTLVPAVMLKAWNIRTLLTQSWSRSGFGRTNTANKRIS
ncbi:MAG: hypothetical protein CM1200mP4_0820 [Rhodospirillaceae bacterium]|nr:MAG: hypothetical protein CM1200mP4_0820 [Rhodospirillaceae bacterium]